VAFIAAGIAVMSCCGLVVSILNYQAMRAVRE